MPDDTEGPMIRRALWLMIGAALLAAPWVYIFWEVTR